MAGKIIIVEDDQDISEVVSMILTSEDYKVLESNVQNLEDDIKKFEPNLIILDYLLQHGISGADLCAKIKRDIHTKHIPVILISAMTDLERISDLCEANAYIAKPFDIADFIKRIKETILTIA